MSFQKNKVAIIGAGTFGTAIANIVAQNTEVLLYSRNEEVCKSINETRNHHGALMHNNIVANSHLADVITSCELLFFTIPSQSYMGFIKEIQPYVSPSQIIIHGTKGVLTRVDIDADERLDADGIVTISNLILDTTCVVKVGCISGPNLAKELYDGYPAATVLASKYDQVIKQGEAVLKTNQFMVFGSYDITGVELSGVLKNVISIASGMVTGLGYGDNTRALLISRGLLEMTRIAEVLGAEPKSFFGLAGIGDLIATCVSKYSRNHTVGLRLSQGETIQEILATMTEPAEGVNTLKVCFKLSKTYKLHTPIIDALYDIVFQNLSIKQGLVRLMSFPRSKDVDFV